VVLSNYAARLATFQAWGCTEQPSSSGGRLQSRLQSRLSDQHQQHAPGYCAPPSYHAPYLAAPPNRQWQAQQDAPPKAFETFVDSDLAPKVTLNHETWSGKENPASHSRATEAADGTKAAEPDKPKKAGRKALAPPGYSKCLVTRGRSGGVQQRLCPTYHLYSQEGPVGSPPRLVMVAQKQRCRTPHYRFFDMARTLPGAKLSKKAGNYVGKLRGNFNRDEYSVYGASTSKTLLGCVVYDKCDVLTQLRDGAQPRKMSMLLPADLGDGPSARSVEDRLAQLARAVGLQPESDVSPKYLQLASKV
jgi:hypothetical protein